MENKSSMDNNNSILFKPASYDFGIIPTSDQPISISSKITNSSNYISVIKFDSLSTESIWFTNPKKITEEQHNSGFNIFNYSKPISSLVLQPKETKIVFCTIIPSKIDKHTFPLKINLPIYLCEIFNDNNNNEPTFDIGNQKLASVWNYNKEIIISASVAVPRFKINPNVLFLEDCIVNTSQSSKFTIRNASKFSISIVIYPPPCVKITTPKHQNYVKIAPNDTVTLSLSHTPKNVGQFDHKIAFDCLESTNSPQILHLMTSVSPFEVPSNFPTIKTDSKSSELDFGEIHSGKLAEKSFVITNDSDVSYNLAVSGIIDIFSPIVSDDYNSGLCSLQLESVNDGPKEQEKAGSSKELKFKTILSAQYGSKLQITLQPHSAIPILIGYTPVFSASVNSDTFDNRNFMISLVFSSANIYYRHINCHAVVCNSQIKIEPSSINLGDTIAGVVNQNGVVQLTNISPLKTTVKVYSSIKALVIAPNLVEVPPKSTLNYTFSFYPKKVTPEFSGIITFSNVNNPNNEVRLTVEAAVIATASESQHSMSYSLNSNGRHLTYLDFNFVPQNFFGARTFVLKNKMKSPLIIKFTSSSPNELFLYFDEKFNDRLKSLSSAKISPLTDSPSQNIQGNDENDLNVLLTPDSPLKPLHDLAEYALKYSSFYENQYVLLGHKYNEKQIVEHFETLLSQFKKNIEKGGLKNVEGNELELQPGSKMELCAVLMPRGDNSYIWKRKQLEFSIEIDHKITSVPRKFPIKFNTCQSTSFLSFKNLNFGTIQVNTHSQYSLNLANESSIPLVFRLLHDPEAPISFDQSKNYGIVSPFSSLTIPFSLSPKIDGKLLSSIAISNVLNIKEEQRANLKGRIVRRSHFFIDPLEIDFGEITAGTSSPKFLIFVTNTSSSENEFTFSNVPNKVYGTNVQPIISYQIKDTKARLLTDKVKLQIEKLGCKLRCLQRKKKWEYAEQIQKVIDELSNTAIESTSLQIKQLGEKFMDSVVYKAEPLQLNCIEVQIIPIIISKKPLKTPENIEGVIMIYESGRAESKKLVKYKAKIVPQKKFQMSENEMKTGLLVEPSSITIDKVYIQEISRIELNIKNIEKSEENFWILSNSSDNAIITSQTNEGKLQPGESIEIPIDVYCSNSGTIMKTITVASQTCWKEIPVTIHAEYRRMIQLSTDKINFGQILLTSLQMIEKRTSLTMTNVSDSTLFVVITHDNPILFIYENDPEELQFKPIRIDPNSSISINILVKTQLEVEMYRKYKTIDIDSTIEIKAYDIKEEAENSLSDSNSVLSAPYYRTTIPVTGFIGRIGFRPSTKLIDFGSLVNQEQVEAKMYIKNRSSKIDVDIISSPTQGITVEPSLFMLKGHQELELTVKYRPLSWGFNEGFILFSISYKQNFYKQKKVLVNSFVDPKIIEVDIDENHKNITKIDLGHIYLNNDGTSIPKSISMNIRNVSRHATTILIPKIDKKYMIRPKEEKSIGIQFPFKNLSLNSDSENSKKRLIKSPSDIFSRKDLIKNSSSSSFLLALNSALGVAGSVNRFLLSSSFANKNSESEDDEIESKTNEMSLKNNSAFSYNLTFISAATKKVVKLIKIEGDLVVSIGSISPDSIFLGRFGRFNNWTVESPKSNIINIHNNSNIDLYMNTSNVLSESTTAINCLNIPNQIGPIEPNSDFQVKIEPIIDLMKNIHLEGPQSNVILFTNNNNHENKMKVTVNYDIRDSFIQVDHAKRGENPNEFLVFLHKFTEIVINNETDKDKDSANDDISGDDKDNEIVTSYVTSAWFSVSNILNKEISVEASLEIEKDLTRFINLELFQRKTKSHLSAFEVQPNEPFEIGVKVTKLKKKWNIENNMVFAKIKFTTENSTEFFVSVIYQPSDI